LKGFHDEFGIYVLYVFAGRAVIYQSQTVPGGITALAAFKAL